MALAVGQILFKSAAERLPVVIRADAATLQSLVTNWHLVAALVVYAIATAFWVLALRGTPLSQAYPFVAIAMVAVPVAAVLLLGETLSLSLVLGTGLVIAGVLVVGLGF